jgi:hypothetical protein
MKLRTIALATTLALSSTASFAVPMPQPKILPRGAVAASTNVIPTWGNTGYPSQWSYRYHGGPKAED